MKKILIIDESALFREYLTSKLVEKGFEAVVATNGLDGLVKLRGDLPDLIIMDFYLSRKSSLELLQSKRITPTSHRFRS